MRKTFISLLAVASLVLAGCGNRGGECEVCKKEPLPENDPKELQVQFVPSKNADQIMLVAPALEALLHDEIPDHTFKISVGTDFNAVLEGMDAGQVQVGFLTSQQYSQASIERPGKVQVLLTSVRNALYVQTLPADKRVAYMNDPANHYRAEYITDEKNYMDDEEFENKIQYVYVPNVPTQVTSYQAMLLTRKETWEGGLKSVKDLAGRKVCALSSSSGSGYIYPSVMLDDVGLKFTTGTPSVADKTVGYVQVSGHIDSLKGMLRGDCDASFSYHDARRDMYWVSASNAAADQDGNGVVDEYETLFDDTRVVDLSSPIYNDTISASTTISQDLRNRIQRAFMNIILTKEGLQALSAYTHTGYKLATDSDYESERKVYRFQVAHGLAA